MMPCKKCSAADEQGRLLPHDKDGNLLRGVKQVRKTTRDGSKAARQYKCQDCGALYYYTVDNKTGAFTEVEGGKDS